MLDRELLELAAKAAGIDYRPQYDLVKTSIGWDTWDPLTDDGDALRLAVKLRIEVDYYLADVQAKHDDCDPVFELLSEHSDACAATRRAIVRAAAAIGEQMP